MDVTIITSNLNDLVHATTTGKKTGCGIPLMKGENVTRYHRRGLMTDLGEITCEKCKAKIAKEIIKADQKEMALILKEEKRRQKMGIEDEGIVPLGNTTAKITKVQRHDPPEPQRPTEAARPSEPQRNIPGTGVAMDNDLAQFAINVPEKEPEVQPQAQAQSQVQSDADFLAQFAIQSPQEEPAPAQPVNNAQDDFLAQFAIQPPQEAPAPAQPVNNAQDDFLAQFAVQPPQEAPTPVQPVNNAQDDFLAQFAVQPPQEAPTPVQPVNNAQNDFLAQFAVQPPQEAPKPVQPVNNAQDDFLAQFAVNTPEPQPVQQPETPYGNGMSDISSKQEDDIMSMFAVGGMENSDVNIPNRQPAPQPVQNISNTNIIDALSENISDYAAEVPKTQEADLSNVNEWDNLADQLFGASAAETPAPQPSAPVLEDIAVPQPKKVAPQPVTPPVPEDIVPPVPQPKAAPVLEDIVIPQPAPAPVMPAPAPQPAPVPVMPAPAPAPQPAPAPVMPAPAPAPQPAPAPVMPAPAPAPQPAPAPVMPAPAPAPQPAPAPVMPAPAPAPQPAPAPVMPAPAPVISDISAATAALNSNPMPSAPVQRVSIPKKPVQPQPAAPVQPQIVTVPQFAGYDKDNQPIYTYVQMQITGYDQNGQPILAPLAGQGVPFNTPVPPVAPAAPVMPAPAQPQEHERLTVGQRIAAAAAAHGDPITANVSKIAVNPHAKGTTQAFINAISESKSYANQSLTDTQGNQAKTVVFDSIEDVLSQLGDDSLKQKKLAEAKKPVINPVFQEYKPPTQNTRRTSSSSSSSFNSKPVNDPGRPLTAKELREKKKQEKIDAKFRKEMAKRKN